MKEANIGKAQCRVFLATQSPFSVLTRREWGYYFTEDNILSMNGEKPGSFPSNIVALPSPINGYRIAERLENYDNFLVDINNTKLEDATASTNGNIKVDSGALSRAKLALTRRNDTAAQEFFTWKTCQNIFDEQPIAFSEMLTSNETKPKWTYNYLPKPDGDKNTEILYPFMMQTTLTPKEPIHWGCTMNGGMPFNQPFEIIYDHRSQVHSIAQEAASKATNGIGGDIFNNFQIDLTKKGYLAIEFGIGSDLQHYLLLFVQGVSPALFKFDGSNPKTLISQFHEVANESLFNPSNPILQVKIEPVKLGLIINIITSTFSLPWIIEGSGESPIFVGEPNLASSQIAVYSGNITAGFSLRPIQYHETGFFKTPAEIIDLFPDDTSSFVKCTPSLKGNGDSQQDQNSKLDGKVYAVDTELLFDVGDPPAAGNIITAIERDFGEEIGAGRAERRIDITVDENVAFLPEEQAAANESDFIQKKIQAEIKLTAASPFPGGFEIKNGRSPYIWQTRCEYAPDTGGGGFGGQLIECDVLSVDMQMNATSMYEVNHSGTIKVLNKPSPSGIDYRNYMNGACYFRIEAGWDNGDGRAPEPIFEGLSTAATLDIELGREFITFRVEDYMSVLEGSKFVLSPWYDGMIVTKAIKHIVEQSGLSESNILITDDPKRFGLGITNPLEEPQYRFKDGESLKSAIIKFATIHGWACFFDAQGSFHYEPIPGGLFGNDGPAPVVDLFSDVTQAPSGAEAIWKMKSITRQVGDVYNAILVTTVNKFTGAIVHAGDNYEISYTGSSSDLGYLGYRKLLIIRDPSLGSEEAANLALDTYRRRVTVPPRTGRFEMYGRGGLKPLDVITVDGDLFRIMNLSYTINAEQNNFYMNVEGEWFDTTPEA